MSKIRNTSFFVPSPELYVRHAINTVGLEDQTAGFSSHALMVRVTQILCCLKQDMCTFLECLGMICF